MAAAKNDTTELEAKIKELEDANAQLASQNAEKDAENAKLLEENAELKAAQEEVHGATESGGESAEDRARQMELVDVEIPLSREDTSDVYVALDGVGEYQLKRGETARVPRCIAEIINTSKKLDADILKRQRALEAEYVRQVTEMKI